VAETDSVLGAFSHDNIGIGTNYELHALTLDYVPMPKTLLTAWWYHYKPANALDAGSNAVGDWLDRIRVHLATRRTPWLHRSPAVSRLPPSGRRLRRLDEPEAERIIRLVLRMRPE
jgi:hypothetical protein